MGDATVWIQDESHEWVDEAFAPRVLTGYQQDLDEAARLFADVYPSVDEASGMTLDELLGQDNDHG